TAARASWQRSSDSVSAPGAASAAIGTLALHDALPIFDAAVTIGAELQDPKPIIYWDEHEPRLFSLIELSSFEGLRAERFSSVDRSEEHTSELQSRENLVCRLLLAKKNTAAPSCRGPEA